MEPRECRESDAQGRPSRRAQLVALLVALTGAAFLITLLFQVPFLQPILATPLAFADLLAIVLGASYVVTFRLVDRRRSNGRASYVVAVGAGRTAVARLLRRARASPTSR